MCSYLTASKIGKYVQGKPQNLIEEVLEQQVKSASTSLPGWRGQRPPHSLLLASKLPASEFDSANSGALTSCYPHEGLSRLLKATSIFAVILLLFGGNLTARRQEVL